MYIEDAKKVKFKKRIGDEYISFSIEKPVKISHNDIYDEFNLIRHQWREMFTTDTKIILDCTIRFDDGRLLSGSLDFDELSKGNFITLSSTDDVSISI